MGNRHYSQMKNKVMSKFYKLQGLRGSLLYIVRLQQVTKVTDIIHRQKIKLCPSFISDKGYEALCCTL